LRGKLATNNRRLVINDMLYAGLLDSNLREYVVGD
jgi:hypothetical protein